MARWATSTDRASFNDADIQRLMMVIHEKIEETIVADEDAPILEHRAIWENIGAQVETLRRYHVCCACLALVHEEDREMHPCGPCTCPQPVVKEDRAMLPTDEESLEYLYTMYYTALSALTQAAWITAFPPLLDPEEPDVVKRARAQANEYDLKIRHRLQRIKDSVTTPLGG